MFKGEIKMDKDRKTYTVSLDNDPDNTYIMALTEDQVKVFNWVISQGYDIAVVEQGDVIHL